MTTVSKIQKKKFSLENLPRVAISKIVDFLDTETKVNFLKATKNFYQEPREKRPKYWCFFCFFNKWYFELPMNSKVGGGEDMAFIFRNQEISREYVDGADGERYRVLKFRRRHYSGQKDSKEINWIHQYMGQFSD